VVDVQDLVQVIDLVLDAIRQLPPASRRKGLPSRSMASTTTRVCRSTRAVTPGMLRHPSSNFAFSGPASTVENAPTVR
jgi:hypothetical protein